MEGDQGFSSSSCSSITLLDSKHGPHIKQAPKVTRGNGVSAAPAEVKDNSSRRESHHLGPQGLLAKTEGRLSYLTWSPHTCSRDDDYEPPAGGQLLDNGQVLAESLGVRDKIRRHG